MAPLPSWVHDEGESSDDEGKSSGEKAEGQSSGEKAEGQSSGEKAEGQSSDEKAEGQSSGAQGTGQSARRDRNLLLGKTQKNIIRGRPPHGRLPRKRKLVYPPDISHIHGYKKACYPPGSKKACSICGKNFHPACFARHLSLCKSQFLLGGCG